MKPRRIDASTLEGGGQLLRTALLFSALSRRPIDLQSIRGRRPKPGLRAQHLTCLAYLASAVGASVEGDAVNSPRVLFAPSRDARAQVGSEVLIRTMGVGAVALVLQAVLPYLLFAGCSAGERWIKLRLEGGTNGHFAPSVDYVQWVLFPNLRLLGFPDETFGEVQIVKRGWSVGSTAAGAVEIDIRALENGSRLQGFAIGGRGGIKSIEAVVLAPSEDTCAGIVQALENDVRAKMDVDQVKILTRETSGSDKRLYLLLIAHTESGWRLGRDWLYDRKLGKTTDALNKACDALVKGVVKDLEKELGHSSCLDEWMEDQIVVFQALARGASSIGKKPVEPTLHTQTARWVAGEVLHVDFDEHGGCEGVGFASGS